MSNEQQVPHDGQDYRAILKRVGIVLIVFGLVDIAFGVYCIINNLSYSSSFNIFAVIAGIFLWRSNLSAVRIVTFFSAFMLTGLTGMLIFIPFIFPFTLFSVWLRHAPVFIALSSVLALLAVILLYWVYSQLRREPIILARRNAGHNTAPPRSAFFAGAALVILLGGLMLYTFKGPIGNKALQLARARYGQQYRYIITSVNSSGHHVHVSLTAYNNHELKQVAVDWDQ